METQPTEPSQPQHHHTPNYEISSPIKPKPKFNKYIAAIVILAIIVTLIILFKPASKNIEQNLTGNITPAVENATWEIIPTPAFLEGTLIWNVRIPLSTAAGNPLSISFNVNNTGNSTASSTLINAMIDSTSVYNRTLTDFAPNETKTLGFTLLSKDASYPAVGSHLLNVYANNSLEYSIGFEVTPRIFAPDLTIRSFIARPEFSITVGKNVSLIASVRNIGNVDAKNASVKLFADTTLLNQYDTNFPMQTSQTLYSSWVPAEPGVYRLKIVAEVAGEVYTDDNELSFNVTVTNSTG